VLAAGGLDPAAPVVVTAGDDRWEVSPDQAGILFDARRSIEEAYRIGACEKVVPDGRAREFAEAMAHEIARFPQACVRADRRSAYMQQGLSLREAMRKEWYNGIPAFVAEGAEGAKRFASGKGRHGDFGDI